MPTSGGYYRVGPNLALTKVDRDEEMPDWSRLLYVTEEAAAKAAVGKEALALLMDFGHCRMYVYANEPGSIPFNKARIAYAPRARAGGEALSRARRR